MNSLKKQDLGNIIKDITGCSCSINKTDSGLSVVRYRKPLLSRLSGKLYRPVGATLSTLLLGAPVVAEATQKVNDMNYAEVKITEENGQSFAYIRGFITDGECLSKSITRDLGFLNNYLIKNGYDALKIDSDKERGNMVYNAIDNLTYATFTDKHDVVPGDSYIFRIACIDKGGSVPFVSPTKTKILKPIKREKAQIPETKKQTSVPEVPVFIGEQEVIEREEPDILRMGNYAVQTALGRDNSLIAYFHASRDLDKSGIGAELNVTLNKINPRITIGFAGDIDNENGDFSKYLASFRAMNQYLGGEIQVRVDDETYICPAFMFGFGNGVKGQFGRFTASAKAGYCFNIEGRGSKDSYFIEADGIWQPRENIEVDIKGRGEYDNLFEDYIGWLTILTRLGEKMKLNLGTGIGVGSLMENWENNSTLEEMAQNVYIPADIGVSIPLDKDKLMLDLYTGIVARWDGKRWETAHSFKAGGGVRTVFGFF